ncbi:hypothetical protein HDZ31DRAFT_68449 [Schizophyllum fasciatum]
MERAAEERRQKEREQKERAALRARMKADHRAFFTKPSPTSAPPVPVYIVKPRLGRNPKFKQVFSIIDQERMKRSTQFLQSSGMVERTRKNFDSTKGTDPAVRFAALPKPDDVTLDWYDPSVFNALSVKKKKYIMDRTREGRSYRIALPTIDLCRDWQSLIDLRDNYRAKAKFMEEYAPAVLADYKFPTAEELTLLAEMELSSDSEGFSDDTSSDSSTGSDDGDGDDDNGNRGPKGLLPSDDGSGSESEGARSSSHLFLDISAQDIELHQS